MTIGDRVFFGVMALACIGLVVGFWYAAKLDFARYNRDMTQCLQDGRKEYECRAILRGTPVQTVIVPMPMGR